MKKKIAFDERTYGKKKGAYDDAIRRRTYGRTYGTQSPSFCSPVASGFFWSFCARVVRTWGRRVSPAQTGGSRPIFYFIFGNQLSPQMTPASGSLRLLSPHMTPAYRSPQIYLFSPLFSEWRQTRISMSTRLPLSVLGTWNCVWGPGIASLASRSSKRTLGEQ